MSPSAILDAIRRHGASAQTKIESLKLELAAAEKEADELAIAERVVQRLTVETGSAGERPSNSDEGAAPERHQQSDPSDDREEPVYRPGES